MKTVLYLLIVLLLVSCEKHEVIDVTVPDDKYTMRYFAHCDSMVVRYNTPDGYYHTLDDHFDTTFECDGGWKIIFIVTSWSNPMVAGVIVNDSEIGNCMHQDFFSVEYYLE